MNQLRKATVEEVARTLDDSVPIESMPWDIRMTADSQHRKFAKVLINKFDIMIEEK